MDLNIKGKKVLIIGSTKGLGYEVSKKFFDESAKLILVGRTQKLLNNQYIEFGGSKNGNFIFKSDLLKRNSPINLCKKIFKNAGVPDIIVYITGGGLGIGNNEKFEKWIDVLRFNVGYSIDMNNFFIPKAIELKKKLNIVHISSISSLNSDKSFDGQVGKIPYASSKAYLNAYVKSISKIYAKEGIRINCILPGVMINKGKFWDKIKTKSPKQFQNFVKLNYPSGKVGELDDVANLILFAASTKVNFLNGSLIQVDGGSY